MQPIVWPERAVLSLVHSGGGLETVAACILAMRPGFAAIVYLRTESTADMDAFEEFLKASVRGALALRAPLLVTTEDCPGPFAGIAAFIINRMPELADADVTYATRPGPFPGSERPGVVLNKQVKRAMLALLANRNTSARIALDAPLSGSSDPRDLACIDAYGTSLGAVLPTLAAQEANEDDAPLPPVHDLVIAVALALHSTEVLLPVHGLP